MREFAEIVTSLPTVIFTVSLLVSLGYWLISTALGLGDSGLDGDLELDADFDSGTDIGSDFEVSTESEADLGIDASLDVDSAGTGSGLGFGSFMSIIGLQPLLAGRTIDW